MDLDKLTQKSQESFIFAINMAFEHQNPEVLSQPLFLALLSDFGGIAAQSLLQIKAPLGDITLELEKEITRLPTVDSQIKPQLAKETQILLKKPLHRQKSSMIPS
jgi:ATP-dependent Clp protease ATP-binding subunit ClpB